jgi:uncharacterized membrane protein
MLVESIVYIVLAFLILVLLVFGFETVGFKLSEALLIFIGSTLLFLTSFPSILVYFRGSLGLGIVDVPLRVMLFYGFKMVGPKTELAIGFDLAGFFIPFFVSLRMMIDRRSPFLASLPGIVIIAVVSYLSSYYVAGEGVVIQNIYAIAIAASIVAIPLSKRKWAAVGPIAYVSGSLGVLLGADLIRITNILAFQPKSFAFASIGGAGVFDAIFLVGVLAVTIDVILVGNVRLIGWIQRRFA